MHTLSSLFTQPRALACAPQGLWTSYGYLFVGTYLSVYVVVLGGTFGLIRAGFIPAPDISAWVNSSRVKQARALPLLLLVWLCCG